jgi:hypothetical protein
MRITHNTIAEYFFFHFKGIKETGNIFLARDKDGRYFVSTFEGTLTAFCPLKLRAKDFYNRMVTYKREIKITN